MKKKNFLSLVTTVALLGSISAYGYEEGANNTFLGTDAGSTVDTGDNHTFIGANAGANQESGSFNAFLGYGSGQLQETGGDNTFLGALSGLSNVAGYSNVFVGTASGYNNTGSNNVFIGFESGLNSVNNSNTLMIQNSSTDTPLIYGEFDNDLIRFNGFMEVNATKKVLNPDVLDAYILAGLIGEDIPETEMRWSMGLLRYPVDGRQQFFIRNFATEHSPFRISGSAQNGAFIIGSDEEGMENNIGIGMGSPQARLDVNGNIRATVNGSNTVNDGLSVVAFFAADNTEVDKSSDAGFGLYNIREDFQWNFRTLEYKDAFTATKEGTGGGEFLVQSPTDNFRDAIVKVAGVTIFEDGHLVTASSRELKTDIRPLDTQEAMEALDALHPVSYAYKAHKDEKVVGFIAEDVPALVAMPSKKSIDSTEIVAVLTSVVKEQKKYLDETRAKMEAMEAKTEAMEAEIAALKGMK